MATSLRGLPGHELLARLRSLVRRGNAVEAELLAHLGEVEARRLFLEEACSSIFVYCLRILRFSESVSYKRIHAARAARKHPEVLEAVRQGDLHLTGVTLLAPQLSGDNCAELLRAAKHKTAEEIRSLLADRRPKPDVKTCVRHVPATTASGAPGPSERQKSREAHVPDGEPSDRTHQDEHRSIASRSSASAASEVPSPTRRSRDARAKRAARWRQEWRGQHPIRGAIDTFESPNPLPECRRLPEDPGRMQRVLSTCLLHERFGMAA